VGAPRRADEVPLPGLAAAPVAAAPAAREPRQLALDAAGLTELRR
jgi:hypothetical protein